MYIVTTLLAFLISAIFNIALVFKNENKYLDVIISYINEKSPVNISISDISLSYPFQIVAEDINIYSKNENNPFLKIDRASLGFNLLRLLTGKNMFYLISSINVSDAKFYPTLLDFSIFRKDKADEEEKSNKNLKEQIEDVMNFFMDKSIYVGSLTLDLSDSKTNASEIAFNSMVGDFRSYRYYLSSDLNLPDNTFIRFSIESDTNLSKIHSSITAEDSGGYLFKYKAESKDIDGAFHLNFFDNENKSIGIVKYDYIINRVDFIITNAVITKGMVHKAFNMTFDIPMLDKVIKSDGKMAGNITNLINNFVYARMDINGNYEIGKSPYINLNASAADKDFNILLKAKLTNDSVILSNARVETLKGSIVASGIVPIKNPITSDLTLDVNNLIIGSKDLSAIIKLKPINVSENDVYSKLIVDTLSYADTMDGSLSLDMLYSKKNDEISFRLSKDQSLQPFNFNIFLNKESAILVKANGTIPQKLFVTLLGYNIIDNLSTMDINYVSSNAAFTGGRGNTHNLMVSSRKIYTEEYLMKLNLTAYSNIIKINDLYYRLSETNAINADANIEYGKNGNVTIEGAVKSPIGDYQISGSTEISNGNRILYVSTEDSSIVASGVIQANGEMNLNIRTPKDIKIKTIELGFNIDIDNTTKDNYHMFGNFHAKSDITPVFAINTGFELSNQNVVFTNIVYDYRENRVMGNGILTSSDGVTKFNAVLQEADTGGALAIDLSINKSNILGTVAVNKLPFSFGIGGGGVYGNLSTKATVIGLLNDPVIYLEEFAVTDFQIPGYRFDIFLTGLYKRDEIELKDILITKTGENGIVTTGAFKAAQQIKIPLAYFSKDLQNMSIEVINSDFLSVFNGKIDYNMRRLANGSTEYRLYTTTIGVNKRKLTPFNTIAIDNGETISFKSPKNHGINGKIERGDKVYNTDLVYVYDNADLLNIQGSVKDAKANQIDLLVTSSTLNVEIFEIFNQMFTSIKSAPTNFMKDGKPYTLYARIYGDADNVNIDGRFVGHGSKVKIAYFLDTFNDTQVDFSFKGKSFNVNTLSFVSGGKKNLTITGEAEILRNNINYMDFDLLTSDEQLGLLTASANIDVARIRGPIHLDMTVGGDFSAPKIGGIITLNKSDVQLTMSAQNQYIQKVYGLISNVYWDFLIEAWQRVRVAHNLVGDVYVEDGSQMRVYNSIANGIELAGSVNIERGSIYYLQNIYQIERGTVTFPDINSLDPIIDATAYTYTKYYPSTALNDIAGYNVTLYMEMNTRVSQLLYEVTGFVSPVRFYTIPALGQYQVNQLAGLPQGTFDQYQNPQVYAETTSSSKNSISESARLQQLTMSYSDLLLRNTVLRPVERWIRQFLGIDYINLSPTVVNNLIFVTNNSRNAASIWDNTSVSIGKYVSKYLYIKYDVTYKFNDPARPTLLNRPKDPYYFDHQFGFEVSLLKQVRLANFVFEYKINPFDVQRAGQDFNIVTRWRF